MKMKKLLTIIIVSLLVSCQEGTDKPAGTIPAGNMKDTAPRSSPEKAINPYAIVDVSPMDMTYFPVDYPKMKMAKLTNDPPLARVIYSRPHLQGRHIFHDVLKYGQPWRLGANESTELELYKDAAIQEKKVKAGRYTLYCVPQAEKWTIVLNSNIHTWGLEQDSTKDVMRFVVPVQNTANLLEYFTIVFVKTPSGADLVMAWDNTEARLPIIF